MIGKTISHYKILEKLGGGGMGIVYAAEDLKLKRIVALKFLPPELTRDPDSKKRFVHEAQAASALQHTNICTIHDIDETNDGQMFICMDYYQGETLKKKIEKSPMGLNEAIDIAIQIAQGLDKAHKKGIVHRDIKPANVMITEDGVAKIVDFGLAKLAGLTKITKEGTTVGTVAYMSPEQTRGNEVDNRSDIWSLGVVFYEMLTGQLPFSGEFDQAILYSILNEEPNPISQTMSNIPDGLEYIINKSLAKNPNERFQDIKEFLNELTYYKESSIIKTGMLKPRKIAYKKKGILWASTTIIVSIIVLLILFYPSETIPFSERDWILITDFENLTEEPVFDKSLNTAFTLCIDQSRYINVISRRRMLETLKRMKITDQMYFDEDIGREIAIREGINIYVVPTISKVGNQYALMSKIHDTSTGNILKSEILYAREQDEILTKLDQLSEIIRKDLGESRFAIARDSKPLQHVTTSSLEALKQYSLAIEHHLNTNFKEAKIFYENALRLDPNFTAAKASLGSILFEKFDRYKGQKLLTEAIQSIDSLSDKEKFGILASYAVNVEHDIEKGIKYTKMRLELYPDDPAPHHNLGWYYQLLGRYQEAIEEYKAAIQINRHLLLSYGGICWIYLEHLGQVDSTFTWSKRLISMDGQNAWGYCYLGSAYAGIDSLDRAQWAYQKCRDLNPNIILNLYRLAHVNRLMGLYGEAIEVLKQILEINAGEISAHYNLGLNYQLIGEITSARKHYSEYLKFTQKQIEKNPKDAAAYLSMGVILTRLGKNESGWQKGHQGIELDSTLYLKNAELYTVLGEKQAALKQLEKLIDKGYRKITWLKLHPDLQSLHSERRFRNLVNQH